MFFIETLYYEHLTFHILRLSVNGAHFAADFVYFGWPVLGLLELKSFYTSFCQASSYLPREEEN